MPFEIATKVVPNMRFECWIGDRLAPCETIRLVNKRMWVCRRLDMTGVTLPFETALILAMSNETARKANAAKDHEAWWDRLALGTFVHYYASIYSQAENGIVCYIRGEVVKKKRSKLKAMKAVALVGNLEKRDYPKRCLDGGVDYGAFNDVKRSYVFRPAYWNIYESPRFQAHIIPPAPSTFPMLEMTIPPMTAEQEKSAKFWRIVVRIQRAVNVSVECNTKLGDWNCEEPQQILETVRKIVQKN